MENDFLEEFLKPVKSNRKAFNVLVFLYAIQCILSVCVMFVSFRLGGIQFSTIISYPVVIFQLCIVHVTPFVALFLLFLKKNVGWILITLLTVINLLFKGLFLISYLLNIKVFSQVSNYVLGGIFLSLTLSIIVLYVIFTKSISNFIKLNNQIKIATIAFSILIFLAIKFYIADYLLKLME